MQKIIHLWILFCMTVQKREDNWKTRYSRDRLKGKRSETAHGAILRRIRYRFSLEVPLSHPPKTTESEIERCYSKHSRKDCNLSFGLRTHKQAARKGVLESHRQTLVMA